jgi:hypothetical protein
MGRTFSRAVVAVAVVGLAALALPNAPVTAAGPDASPTAVGSARTYGSWLMVSSNGERVLNDTTKHALVGLDASTKKLSRPYYRFSTSALAGKHILSATFQHKLIHSPNPDCSLTSFGPAVEVGRTANFTSTTAWPGPAWLQTLDSNSTVHGVQGTCPGAKTPEWDIEAGVEAVAAARQPVIVLGLRSADETNADGWRVFDNETDRLYPNLTVVYNTPPNVPSQLALRMPAAACGSDAFPVLYPSSEAMLEATVTDPDDNGMGVHGLVARYEVTAAAGGPAIWTHAETSVSSGVPTRVSVPPGLLQNGSIYRFRVRAEEPTDEGPDLSAWSQWCHFTVDTSRPPMPTVHSDVYPDQDAGGPPTGSGGVGVPGTFVISSSLRSDVVVYWYSFNTGPWKSVTPSATTRTAKMTFTPTDFGVNSLRVYASDRAGNQSETRVYRFEVASG